MTDNPPEQREEEGANDGRPPPNRKPEAIDHLLEIVKRNRTWNEDAARKQLLTLFDALGFKDELAQSGRRRLSALLFT